MIKKLRDFKTVTALVVFLTIIICYFEVINFDNFLVIFLYICIWLLILLQIDFKGLKKINYKMLLICLIPVIVRILLYTGRFHSDEALLSYFSKFDYLGGLNFFKPVPLNPADWVVQFPSIYFVFQKIIFFLFGTGLLQARMYVLIFVFISSIFIYKTAKVLNGKFSPAIAVILYAFFSFAIYFETWSFINLMQIPIASALMFLNVNNWDKPSPKNIIAILILSGCTLLGYTGGYVFLLSSYIYIFALCVRYKKKYIKPILNGIVLSAAILAPFFLQMTISNNFYVLKRINDVTDFSFQLGSNLFYSIYSLVNNNIGGSQYFDFGHLAVFEIIGFILFSIGFIYLLYSTLKRHDFKFSTPVIIFVLVFIGVVVTAQPPSYGRLLIALPSMIIIMHSALAPISHYLLKIKNLSKKITSIILILIIAGFIYSNIQKYQFVDKKETPNPNLVAVDWIKSNCDGCNLHIIAFTSHHFYKFIKVYYPEISNVDITADIQIQADYKNNIYYIVDPKNVDVLIKLIGQDKLEIVYLKSLNSNPDMTYDTNVVLVRVKD